MPLPGPPSYNPAAPARPARPARDALSDAASPLAAPLSPSPQQFTLAGALNAGFEATYGKKLELIEQIRHELRDEHLNTPGIIVIGSQSSGKSSILARLTGISFPTGAGTCTRSPAVVSVQTDPAIVAASPTGFHALVSDDASFEGAVECGSLRELHTAISDFTKQLTSRITKPITEDPIYIRHTRASGPAMTLIDLPGITQYFQENTAFDIHAVTAGLVRRYMADENMIALVVLTANDDFGNSEALKIAKECDRDGARTIGVVSKCDLVPESNSDIVQKLRMARGNDVQLELGFYAVSNPPLAAGDGSTATALSNGSSSATPTRNNNMGNSGMMSADVDAREEALFREHPLLSKIPEEKRGVGALSRKLLQIQGRAVDRFFATARTQLYDRTRDLRAKLGDMAHIPETPEERRAVLTEVLRAIDGRIEGLLRTDSVREPALNIPTRTLEFCETFVEEVSAEVPLLLSDEFLRGKIEKNYREARGRVLPDVTVDSLVHQVIDEVLLDTLVPGMTARLIEKHEALMTRVYEAIIGQCTDDRRFPKLANFIGSVTKDVLAQASHKASDITSAVVAAERTGSFTMNPMYVELTSEMRRFVLAQGSQSMKNATSAAHVHSQNAAAAPAPMDNVYPNAPPSTVGSENAQRVEPAPTPDVPLLHAMPRILWQPGFAPEELGQFIQRHVDAEVSRSPNPDLLRVQFSTHCYAQIVLKRLFDVLPMLVRNIVVHETHRSYHCEIERRLGGRSDELAAAMTEDADETQRRRELSSRIERLQEVYDKVKSI